LKARLTVDRLMEKLRYAPETGVFTWNSSRYADRVGKVAGYLSSNGYWRIMIDKRLYLAHRLAWLYMYGEWPSAQVDHINNDRSGNRIDNLRDVSAHVNQRNRKGEYVGVSKAPCSDRWRARHGDAYIGMFDTKEEARSAVQAYREEAIRSLL